MHECDKDERIRKIEESRDKDLIRLEIIKTCLTPKTILAVIIGLAFIIQVIMKGG
jgi:hypothetical protein